MHCQSESETTPVCYFSTLSSPVRSEAWWICSQSKRAPNLNTESGLITPRCVGATVTKEHDSFPNESFCSQNSDLIHLSLKKKRKEKIHRSKSWAFIHELKKKSWSCAFINTNFTSFYLSHCLNPINNDFALFWQGTDKGINIHEWFSTFFFGCAMFSN